MVRRCGGGSSGVLSRGGGLVATTPSFPYEDLRGCTGAPGCPDAPFLAGGPTILRVGTWGRWSDRRWPCCATRCGCCSGSGRRSPPSRCSGSSGTTASSGSVCGSASETAWPRRSCCPSCPSARSSRSSSCSATRVATSRRSPDWSTTSRLAPPGPAHPPGEHAHPVPHALRRAGPARGGPQGLRQRGGGHRVPDRGLLEPDIDTDRGFLVTGGYLFGLIAVAFVLRTVSTASGCRPGTSPGACSPPTSRCCGSSCWEPGGQLRGPGADWVLDRRLSTWVLERWQALTELLGPLNGPVRSLGHQAAEFVANADRRSCCPSPGSRSAPSCSAVSSSRRAAPTVTGGGASASLGGPSAASSRDPQRRRALRGTGPWGAVARRGRAPPDAPVLRRLPPRRQAEPSSTRPSRRSSDHTRARR